MTDLTAEIKKLKGPIVIFGAGGFIGANLFRAILAVRNDCFAVTHQQLVPWRLQDLPADNILYADLNKPETLRIILDKFNFKTIFNFAAYGSYSKQRDIEQIYKTNIVGPAILLELCAAKGFAAFVQAGSSSEYGINSAAPKEEAQLIPNSHYAVSKVADSALAKYYGQVKKLPVINLRLYSAYGPYEEPDRLIPVLLSQGLAGKYPPLVAPDISRDFVYIDDIVEATVLAANVGVQKIPGGSLNIATGNKTKVRDIVQLAKEIFNLDHEPVWGTMPNRMWDLSDWYGDPTKAQEVLGWKATTTLKEGLKRTSQWMRGYTNKNIAVRPAKTPKISAVIACYKDGEAIPIMHERLTTVFTQLCVDYEIIFVNDGSPDNSNEVLTKLTATDKKVIAVEHSRNFGSQSAFLSGMQIATGDAVVLLDGDLQDPPEIIPEFYKEWVAGYEVVYGSRVKRQATGILNACYKLFYRIFRGVAYIPIPLDAGDFSLMDRKVVDQLLALPETDQFLRGLRAWVGFKQTGVDYVRPERMFGRTTNNWRKNIWWAKKAIFSFSFIPLEMVSYFGYILAIISFLGLIWQVVAHIIFPEIPQGISTIIVLLLFFGAIQMIAVSILGEYLAKIFEETKNRPKFIRKTIQQGGATLSTQQEMAAFVEQRQA
ncbi:MAG: NAD-dependent epimerase/dehydratase family protein [bacterium]